jgi:hypothetical protein
MKKLVLSIALIVIVPLVTGFENVSNSIIEKKINSQLIYHQGIWDSKHNKNRKPINSRILLFKNKQEWDRFSKIHLTKIPISKINFKSKNVVLMKPDWKGKDYSYVPIYDIKSITLSGKTMIFSVKSVKGLSILTNPPSTSDDKYSDMIICLIDSKDVPNKAKLILKVIK